MSSLLLVLGLYLPFLWTTTDVSLEDEVNKIPYEEVDAAKRTPLDR